MNPGAKHANSLEDKVFAPPLERMHYMRILPLLLALVALSAVSANGVEAQTGWILAGPPADSGMLAGLHKVSGQRVGPPTAHDASEADVERAQEVWDRAFKAENDASANRILLESLLDMSAPIEKWQQLMAFDTAQACEATRVKNMSKWDSIIDTQIARGLTTENWSLITGAIRFKSGRCVPASALYPQIRR
jgi:hypothetical protein